MTRSDFIKIALLVIIGLQLFSIDRTLKKIHEERIIRVSEIKHYTVDIASYGSITVPTELDYPGNDLYTREGR